MMIPPVPIPIPLRPRHPVLFGYRPKVRKNPPTALVASGVGRAVVFVRKKWTLPTTVVFSSCFIHKNWDFTDNYPL